MTTSTNGSLLPLPLSSWMTSGGHASKVRLPVSRYLPPSARDAHTVHARARAIHGTLNVPFLSPAASNNYAMLCIARSPLPPCCRRLSPALGHRVTEQDKMQARVLLPELQQCLRQADAALTGIAAGHDLIADWRDEPAQCVA